MFSHRLDWHEPPNKLSRLLAKKHQNNVAVLHLMESNPTKAGFSNVPQEKISIPLIYQPKAKGIKSARLAIAAFYQRQGVSIDADNLWITTSTSEAYSYLFKLLTNPGEKILVPEPSYPLFESLARLEGIQIESYPLWYDGRWYIDLALLKKRAKESQAIVIVNPNNPTGSFLKQNERAVLEEIGLPIISDEVFSVYSLSEDRNQITSLAKETDFPCFVLNGFSKLLGLPQVKLAWILVTGPQTFRQEAEKRLEWIFDAYLSVSAPIQEATKPLLDQQESYTQSILERLKTNKQLLQNSLTKNSPCNLLHLEGGWYAILRVPSYRSEEEWVLRLLEQENIYLHPGHFYHFSSEAFLVLSLITSPDIFADGIKKLFRHIEKDVL